MAFKMSTQRSRKRVFSSDSESEEDKKKEDGFQTLLSGCGLKLINGYDRPHELNCDRSVFLKDLTHGLKCDANYPASIQRFLDDFKSYLESDVDILRKALGPVKPKSDGDTEPESLLRILLNVEQLQAGLIGWLLEKLALLALEGKSCNKDLPRLILCQLRWLNFIQNGEALSDKLLDILQVTPDDIAQEVIGSLPEIITDPYHAKVAMALRDKLTESNNGDGLTATILDTFTNLSLKKDVLQELQSGVLKTLPSADPAELPVIVKFVLSTIVDPSEALQIVDQLRDNLDLEPPSLNLSQYKKTRRPSSANIQDNDVIIVDILRVSMTCEPTIGVAFLRSIDAVHSVAGHKPLDLLVMFLLYSLPNRKKAVESLLKNKIRHGLFTEELAKKTFSGHTAVLRSEFDTIQSLAELLMQSNEPILNHYSTIVHREAFLSLGRYCQQEIVADLVSKVASDARTRQISLQTLEYLARHHTSKLAYYALFVSGILDHVHTMELKQVRQAMDILSSLAYNSKEPTTVLRDDINMVIRKQLSANIKIKQMGVIGAVVTVKNMAKTNGDGEQLGQALQMLVMVRDATKNLGSIAGLFMDELSSIIGKDVNPELLQWIAETMTHAFQEEFIVDIDPNLDDGENFKLRFGLENVMTEQEEESPVNIAIDVPAMVSKSLGISSDKQATAAARLVPHFRLISRCLSVQTGGNLEDIDALLSCPLWMPKDTQKMDCLSMNEKNVTTTVYFYSINWFREVINSFSDTSDAEERNKVLVRLKNLLALQKELLSCLKYNLNYVPPPVLHLVDISSWQPPGVVTNKMNKDSKGKGKGKKRKADLTVANLTAANTQLTQTECSDSAEVSLQLYEPFFRELDMSVFKVLSYNTVNIGSEGTQEEELKNPVFRPTELLFLLKDLFKKLSHCLLSSKNKKIFPGLNSSNLLKNAGFSNLDQLGQEVVAQKAVELLDYLLANLEIISDFFKGLIDINDGLMDAPSVFNEHTPLLVSCFEYSLLALKATFSWAGFHSKDQRGLLKEALVKVARRYKVQLTSSSSVEDLVLNSIKYFGKFKGSIINIGTAHACMKLMDAIHGHSGEKISGQVAHELCDCCQVFLAREWANVEGTKEKGSKFNQSLEYLVQLLIGSSDKPLQVIMDYIDKGIKRQDPEALPTLNKSTLAMHYKVMFSNLVSIVKKTTFGSNKDHEEQLGTWEASVSILASLTDTVKGMESPRVFLGPLLKGSRQFLEHFLKHCMPLMDKLFRSRRDECIGLLKKMQTCTRYWQHVCSHSKLHKDVSLSNHVPLLKKALETFVFRVKAMLALNNAVNAFWLGNLKNRDLQGGEIQSQTIEEEEEDDDDRASTTTTNENNGEEDNSSDMELDESLENNQQQREEEDANDSMSIEI